MYHIITLTLLTEYAQNQEFGVWQSQWGTDYHLEWRHISDDRTMHSEIY